MLLSETQEQRIYNSSFYIIFQFLAKSNVQGANKQSQITQKGYDVFMDFATWARRKDFSLPLHAEVEKGLCWCA